MNVTISEETQPINVTIIDGESELKFTIQDEKPPLNIVLKEVFGKDGIDGKDGVNGVDGRDGIDGQNGIDGAKGETGERGEKGEVGAQGVQGIKGEKGDKGEDFKFEDFTSEQLNSLKPIETFNFQMIEGELIVQDGTGFQVDLVNGELIIN